MERPELIISRYASTESQVPSLRVLCRSWRDEKLFWDFDAILQTFSTHGSLIFFAATAERPELWTSMIFARQVMENCEIVFVYVRPEFRGQGHASRLFDELFKALGAISSPIRLTLEVRSGNDSARQLYEAKGLCKIGVRPHYYADGEDACLYHKEVSYC